MVPPAGLLDNRRATTHWNYLREMLGRSPTIDYVPDRRMVSDDAVTTTTGISASMPMMLTLIEAIAGRPKAQQVAAGLGVTSWDAPHASQAFRLTRPFALTVLANRLSFWTWEELDLLINNRVDEVSLALAADTWSRSNRSSVRIDSASGEAITSANGIRILPDSDAAPNRQIVASAQDARPADVLEQTLEAVAHRHGPRTGYGGDAARVSMGGGSALKRQGVAKNSNTPVWIAPTGTSLGRTERKVRKENIMPSTVKLHRVFAASPQKVFRAFVEPDALASWLPPYGFLCTVHEFDARVGGAHRMSFRNFTTGESHSFGGTYREFVPGERLVYTDSFDDANLPGEMLVTVAFAKVSVGTEVTIEQTGIPNLIPREGCYLGWQDSLEKLVRLVQPEIAG